MSDSRTGYDNSVSRSTGRSALKAQGLSGHKVIGAPASVFKRCIATGDNNEEYVATDAAFKEFQIDEDMLYWPPGRMILSDKVVEKVEDCRWDKTLAEQFCVKFGQSMPTIHDDDPRTAAPERDLVNYPRPKRVIYPEATRLLIFPDNWFRELYPKTGVTGPYVLVLGLGTFLFSKEWLIYEHEMHFGVHLAILITAMVYKWGPLISRYLEGAIDVSTW